MKKLSALLLVSLFAIGCASSATSNGSGGRWGFGSTGSANASHYRLLSDPGNVREMDWSNPPSGLHVKGRMTTAGFQPTGQVEGRGSLCAGGKDFVTLSDGKYHAAADGATPTGHHVYGCRTRTGGFKPASREVLTQQ
jgi:hypothetical protein